MLSYLHVPFGWGELIKRTVKEIVSDDVLSLAAQQAYFFFFALFPALLTVRPKARQYQLLSSRMNRSSY